MRKHTCTDSGCFKYSLLIHTDYDWRRMCVMITSCRSPNLTYKVPLHPKLTTRQLWSTECNNDIKAGTADQSLTFIYLASYSRVTPEIKRLETF